MLGSVPTVSDAEFFRQKSARLHTRSYTDRIIFQTSSPELYLVQGGIYQPSAVLLPTPGQLIFSLPILVPSGCARIGLLIQPSRFVSILGFLNEARSANGTAVNLPANPISESELAAGTFSIPLPNPKTLEALPFQAAQRPWSFAGWAAPGSSP